MEGTVGGCGETGLLLKAQWVLGSLQAQLFEADQPHPGDGDGWAG